MSNLHYSSRLLEPYRIRLLRLTPHQNKTAPIRCELFEYSFQESDEGTHMYEALSYVWGDPLKTLPILIGEHHFNVTVNLHAALSRLRGRFFPRIIWIDAICINQNDQGEKERQIQSMARIYGQATRVIVWLGQMECNSDRALEAIRLAAGKSAKYLNDDINQQAILALLKQEWFRRIWVREQMLNNIGGNY